MRQALSPSTGKRDGLARLCGVWQVARSTVYRHRQLPCEPRRRPGPQGPCPDDELLGHIRTVLQTSGFYGEGYRKVWARLRYRGMRTSPKRVLRVMRAHHLLAPKRRGNPHGPKAHDGTIIPERIDMLWGTDMTATLTRHDGQVAIFVAVDHFSAECVGIHVATHGTRLEALEPIRQGVREPCGALAQDMAHGLVLRHDHGSQYMSQVFQDEIAFLGMESSPAFVREPQGKGCAERFIRTLKENLLWLTTFDTVAELRVALLAFKQQYNETWLIGRHGYKTPSRVRQEQMMALEKQAA
jgi:putative transposase